MSTKMLERRFAGRRDAYVRQGDWCFVPSPEVNPPLTLVLFDESLSGGRGQAHVMEFAYRHSEVFAKGAIRHPDHPTLVLWGWHRVAMNTIGG